MILGNHDHTAGQNEVYRLHDDYFDGDEELEEMCCGIGVESPTIAIPTDAASIVIEFDVYEDS